MIKTLRYIFLWLFAGFTIFACSKEKVPEPIPEDTRTTREYLASKVHKQILTFDANSISKLVTDKGLIIEPQPGVWKDYLNGTAINGSVQLEVRDLSSNKDFILNQLDALNPYMNINNGILRLDRGFHFSPSQSGKGVSGMLNIRVPLKDLAISGNNQAQLVGCAQGTDPEVLTKWGPSGVKMILNTYFPSIVADNTTGKQYYEVKNLEFFSHVLGIGDNWPAQTGAIRFGVGGDWESVSGVKPVIYLIPAGHLAPQRLEISGNKFNQKEGLFYSGTDITVIGIQYDKGKIFFGKMAVKVSNLSPDLKLKLVEVNEEGLMNELTAL